MTLAQSDLRTDAIVLQHDLAAVVRFLDPFTLLAIPSQFSVSIPALRWSALWRSTDSTYRFSVSNLRLISSANPPIMPSGTFPLQVALPGTANASADPPGSLPRGPYAVFEPLSITLPPAAPHPPPVLVSDFLVSFKLFPTLNFIIPAGETAIVGRIVSASNQNVAGLQVFLFTGAAPVPTTPYTRTDAAGQFLYRLPGLKRKAGMSTIVVGIQVFSADNPPVQLVVTPASLSIPPAAVGLVTRNQTLNIP